MFEILRGPQYNAKGGWYRQDAVEWNGILLRGFIQIRCRGRTRTVLTVSGDKAVKGKQLNWLLAEHRRAEYLERIANDDRMLDVRTQLRA